MNGTPIPKNPPQRKIKRSRVLSRVSSNPANVKLRAKKRKEVTITKLKAILWQLCRQITFSDYGNTCYSCGAVSLVGVNLQCGHFIPSSLCSMELRFSLDNLRPQCMRCNIHLSGNWIAYKNHLREEKGADFPEWLEKQNEATKGGQYGKQWVEEKIKEYQALL